MAQLSGSTDKAVTLQASTSITGMVGSKDLEVNLMADKSLSVNLLGEFGVGYTEATTLKDYLGNDIRNYLDEVIINRKK